MKLDQQVCSLELAKRFKELGVKQESLFYWEHYSINGWCIEWCELGPFSEHAVSAFTVAELGEMLPDCIKYEYGYEAYIKSQKKDTEYKIYLDDLEKVAIFFDENEANARAKMLIYLLENGLIEDIKIFVLPNALKLVLGEK